MKTIFCFFLFYSLSLLSASPDESQAEALKEYSDSVDSAWQTYSESQTSGWDQYKKTVEKNWRDVILPSEKIYVDYYNDFKSRVLIDFEKGRVRVEILGHQKLSKKSIAAIIKTGLARNKDLLDGQLTFTEDFESLGSVVAKKGMLVLNMVPDHVKRRAKKYLPSVLRWSAKNSIPAALILAVMWQESAFNPKARSHIPAFGLMQIVPKYAGEEVKSFLGESLPVDGDFLYESENNIRYGSTYLKLLSEKYFQNITPFEKRAPFIIAAYNWGPTRLLKHLKKGTIKLSGPDEIKNQIIFVAPQETKSYIDRVLGNWKKIENDQWLVAKN